MTKVYNRVSQTRKRQSLRRTMPRAEALLWSKLRGRRILGFRFRRQYGVGPFVVDFYCPELKLAIEIDGDSHYQKGADQNDSARQTFIESFGILFLRFTNNQVRASMDDVLESMTAKMQELGEQNRLLNRHSPHPNPPPARERGVYDLVKGRERASPDWALGPGRGDGRKPR